MIVNVFGPAAQNFGEPDPCSGGGTADSPWYQKLCANGIPQNITPPVADAGPDQILFENEVVYFNASGSTGNITTYKWDFDIYVDSDGDGDPANDVDATGMTPNHTYEEHGEYRVKLTVNTTFLENVTADQDVVFIVDRSGSISDEELEFAKVALKDYTYEMKDPDRGAVVHFSNYPVLMHHLTDNYGNLRTDIQNIPDPYGGTNMGPAIHEATDELINYSQVGHISIEILFSDGMPSNSQDALDEAEFAEVNNIVIHTVGLDIEPNSTAEDLMINIAEITGGNYYSAIGAENLSEIYMEISQDVKESIFVDTDMCRVTVVHVNEPPVADAGPDQTVNTSEIVEFDGSSSFDPDDFWRITTVNTEDYVSSYTSMALDSHDYPHIAYRDDMNMSLKYARWNGSSWEIKTVVSNEVYYGYISMAIDKYDLPHICYQSGYPDYNLKYVRWDGSAWHNSTADPSRNAGYYGSIAIDSLGNPHIGYQLGYPDNDLKYASWDGSNWNNETVNSFGYITGFVNLALDENDYPHLSFHDGYPTYDLRYAYWTGSTWNDEAIVTTNNVGSYSSMVLDGNGYAHITYPEWSAGYIMKYLTWNGSTWYNETVDSSDNLGYYPSIAVDNDNRPHISYHKGYPNDEVRYAERTESGWNTEIVNVEDYVGSYTSIQVDSIYRAHISYVDLTYHDLKYAWIDDVIVTYDWEFESGSPHGPGKRTNHSFSNPGTYEVILTVTDTHGLSGFDTCNITVVSSGGPPVADAGFDQTVNEGDVVLFDGSASVGNGIPGGSQPINSNVVALYHMNEGSGNSISDKTNNNNHGTTHGTTWTSGGKYGYALSFDGVDDYVEVSDDSSLDIINEITIEAWVYPRSINDGNYHRVVDKYYGGTGYALRIETDGDFSIDVNGWMDSEIALPGNSWSYIVGVSDGTYSTLYLNGQMVKTGQIAFPSGNMEANNLPVRIGCWAGGQQSHFDGIIDEVVIWNKKLSSQEILDYYNSGKEHFTGSVGSPTGIISYEWDFESDGVYDYQETPINAPDGAFDGKTEHVYGDDGIYTVTIRVTNDQNLTDTDTCNVTVSNLDPIIEPCGPFTIDEGSQLDITAPFSDPGSDDLTFTCSWGDGTSDTVMTYYNDDPNPEPAYDPTVNEIKSPWGLCPFQVTDTMSHTYGDDGVYNITLTLEDDDGGTTTSMTTVTVYNVEPEIDSITAPPGSEGSLILFSSTAADIGTDDLTFTWNWGDGTPQTTTTHYNDGTGPDPLPSPWGTYPFTATDTQTHIYGDDGVYTITLTVEDDDEGVAVTTTDVVINNVAPTITLVIAPSGDEGSELTFSADVTDPGSDDLEFSWNFEYGPIMTNTHYNDGTGPDPLKSPWGTYPFSASDTVSHTYGDNYGYTLELTVTDDDGGTTIYTTTVTIDNVAPSITQIAFPSSGDEGSPSSYQATSTDPGSDDLIFTWEFELGTTVTNSYYNDGTGPDPYPSPGGTFQFSATDSVIHTYGDNGMYDITLTIEDDDGGITTYTTAMVVYNIAPTIEPLGPFEIDEGSSLDISAISTDPGSDDLTFTWEFEFNPAISNVHYNDGGSPDPPTSPWGTFPFSATDLVTLSYGDNGVYNIILTVEDDDGGTTTYTTNITVNNVAPTMEPFGPFTLDECSLLELFTTSTDPGSDDLTFTWIFGMGPTIINTYNNDVANPDPFPSPWGTYPYSVMDSVDHIYGDNGIYPVTLTVSDDDGGMTSHTANITVNNVAPEIVSIEMNMYVNITLRVAGEKYHSVGVHLYEEGSEIWTAQVTRYPGSPDKQTATISGLKIDLSKTYSTTVDYLPNDPRINGNVWGANPVWIDITFENGSVKRLHHTFNVRQSYWDSDHWNHIDPWEVDINTNLVGCAFEITSRITDPGSDDIFLTYTYGSQIVNVTCLCNPPFLDPYPSPEVMPMDLYDTISLSYEGPGTISLDVTDDDGGAVFQVINIL
jgi:PKD repeat protein